MYFSIADNIRLRNDDETALKSLQFIKVISEGKFKEEEGRQSSVSWKLLRWKSFEKILSRVRLESLL